MPINGWEEWLQRVRDWAPPTDQGQIEMAGSTMPEMSRALVNKLLMDTNASNLINPWYLRRLRGNAAVPGMQEMVMRYNTGGGIEGTATGEFLKNWITTNPSSGWGNISGPGGVGGWKEAVGAMLDKLQQGAYAPADSPEALQAGYFKENPELMAAILGMERYGPGGDYIRQLLGRTLDAGPLKEGQQLGDWLDWLLRNSLSQNRYPSPAGFRPSGAGW